jgi:hypothetical protein
VRFGYIPNAARSRELVASRDLVGDRAFKVARYSAGRSYHRLPLAALPFDIQAALAKSTIPVVYADAGRPGRFHHLHPKDNGTL